ncbi:MAG: hypothetical protein Q4B42_03610 [Oscillospiraceae bacterium]|nr:hypothetical protein [Oscillospiraceae bacterium]
MKTVYIDNDFKCYTENAEGRTAIETDFFDGKCKAYIEGHRFIPEGQSWTREDGVVFEGEMISPFKDSAILEAAQAVYEELAPVIDDLLVAVCS